MVVSIPLCSPPTSGNGGEEEGQYRLLELPEEIARLIEAAQEKQTSAEANNLSGEHKRKRNRCDEGERECLIINGRRNDEAVLSTQDKTYALREVSQSNSMLLCAIESRRAGNESSGPGSGGQLTMKVNVSSLLELTNVVPRLDRITTLLKASAYRGEHEEKNKIGMRKYTPREVRSIVQASDSEIQNGYKDRCVTMLDGYMRSVAPSYVDSLLRSLVLIMDSNSYLPNSLPIKETVQGLMDDHDVRSEVASALLTAWFGRVCDDDASAVALDMDKMARFVGEELLKARALQPLKLEDFMEQWRSRLSGGGQASSTDKDLADLKLLKGLYILFPVPPQVPNPPNLPRTIQYYPKSLLPLEPAPRFQELFLTRSQWFLEELEPFIEDLSVDSKRREALMLRYARAKKVKMTVPRDAGSKTERATSSTGVIRTSSSSNAVETKEVTVYSARVRY